MCNGDVLEYRRCNVCVCVDARTRRNVMHIFACLMISTKKIEEKDLRCLPDHSQKALHFCKVGGCLES